MTSATSNRIGHHCNCLRLAVAALLGLKAFVGPGHLLALEVPQFELIEKTFQHSADYVNPYKELQADAWLTEPDGRTVRRLPLFWDGGNVWKFRFAPDKAGLWRWTVQSPDPGLNGKSGDFTAVPSGRAGSLQPMPNFPLHFQRQDGSPFWFMGDTAWALFTDSAEEKHDRAAALRYIDARAGQGINVLHSMLLSEAGWGNRGGAPFEEISAEKINPSYWQEVDVRLAHANRKGIVCGLALAWGDKRRVEPYAWRKFPSVEARQRYARHIAARYSAYDVYFIVSGEWHAEIRTRDGATEEGIRREFFELGDALKKADPHGRMIAIHPMTAHGSVREFNEAAWMSFGDYQQNYRDLHERLLVSRSFHKPAVNSEYGYFLRDQSGDGVPDKDNSTSLEAMRHATWDIVMAGGYIVTGFGTTYFGGNRDPGPFDLDAAKNDPWEEQLGHMKKCFAELEWWKLSPHDELVTSTADRGSEGKEFGRLKPPETTYWCLAEAGRQYLFYGRGLKNALKLRVEVSTAPWQAREFNPRTGAFRELTGLGNDAQLEYCPPDEQDWVVLLTLNRGT